MNDNHLISVIVPVYNGELFIYRCINSILNQTYRHLEVIVINDGSTDCSDEILKELEKNDCRIKYIYQTNSGVSAARNRGIEHSTGDFIAFVDCDDYIEPNMYKTLLCKIIENQADIAECGYSMVNNNGTVIQKHSLLDRVTFSPENCCREYLSRDNSRGVVWNKLFTSKIFDTVQFPILRYSEDHVVNAKAFLNCFCKVTVSDTYYNYVQNSESATKQKFGHAKLDVITAGEQVVKIIQGEIPELSDLAISYLLDNIIVLFVILKKSEKDIQSKYRGILLNAYKRAYSLRNFSSVFEQFSNRTEFARMIFRLSPDIYLIIENMKKMEICHK